MSDSNRVPPLNLTAEEADYLWEMLQEEIGKKGVWEDGYDRIVSSLHTKVRRISHERYTGSDHHD